MPRQQLQKHNPLAGAKIPEGIKPANSVFPQKALQKNAGGNPSPGTVLKDSFLKDNTQIKNPEERGVPAKEIFRAAASSLGFPKDALSISLLAFTRFFSISPNQTLIYNLRREILNLLKGADPAKAAGEAKTLALVSAFDKGVALLPEALERYARYLLPPALMEKELSPPKEVNFRNERGSAPERKGDCEEEEPDAKKIKAIAEEESQKDALLDFMNYFTGKNGQHWLIFPFNIIVRNTELNGVIRILSGEDNQIITDISGPKRKWRCVLKKNSENVTADIQVFPGYSERSLNLLQARADRFLGEAFMFPDEKAEIRVPCKVTVRNGEENPSWTEDICSECLPSINKMI
jgi:hypothetical protein